MIRTRGVAGACGRYLFVLLKHLFNKKVEHKQRRKACAWRAADETARNELSRRPQRRVGERPPQQGVRSALRRDRRQPGRSDKIRAPHPESNCRYVYKYHNFFALQMNYFLPIRCGAATAATRSSCPETARQRSLCDVRRIGLSADSFNGFRGSRVRAAGRPGRRLSGTAAHQSSSQSEKKSYSWASVLAVSGCSVPLPG